MSLENSLSNSTEIFPNPSLNQTEFKRFDSYEKLDDFNVSSSSLSHISSSVSSSSIKSSQEDDETNSRENIFSFSTSNESFPPNFDSSCENKNLSSCKNSVNLPHRNESILFAPTKFRIRPPARPKKSNPPQNLALNPPEKTEAIQTSTQSFESSPSQEILNPLAFELSQRLNLRKMKQSENLQNCENPEKNKKSQEKPSSKIPPPIRRKPSADLIAKKTCPASSNSTSTPFLKLKSPKNSCSDSPPVASSSESLSEKTPPCAHFEARSDFRQAPETCAEMPAKTPDEIHPLESGSHQKCLSR